MMRASSNCAWGGLNWILGKLYSLKKCEVKSIGTDCPRMWGSQHSWWGLKDTALGTCVPLGCASWMFFLGQNGA